MIDIIVRQPETEAEWNQYFDLRWRILRQPWDQPPGSEKDDLEDISIHRMAVIKKNGVQQILAIGRLHLTQNNNAQIRYMAVDKNHQHQGIGQQILQSLEAAALKEKVNIIRLNARENAIDFYQKNHYKTIGPAHTLYDEIRHVKMKKSLPST
ncbi:MAG: GNAT family N-acetyltransferase [Gammaproteobacteria bacterium]|nr:GNAT family N-acetyltransferase [Gammaproteobacteria bacterium]